MTVSSNIQSLVDAINERRRAMDPDSAETKAAFARIGAVLQAKIIMNIRSKGIVSSGTLLNSIRFEPYREGEIVGIRVGSFGVKYAAMHEFGGAFTDRMRRAMFYSFRLRGRDKEKKDKNVIRGGFFHSRPFLRPAIDESQEFIADQIIAAITGGNDG